MLPPRRAPRPSQFFSPLPLPVALGARERCVVTTRQNHRVAVIEADRSRSAAPPVGSPLCGVARDTPPTQRSADCPPSPTRTESREPRAKSQEPSEDRDRDRGRHDRVRERWARTRASRTSTNCSLLAVWKRDGARSRPRHLVVVDRSRSRGRTRRDVLLLDPSLGPRPRSESPQLQSSTRVSVLDPVGGGRVRGCSWRCCSWRRRRCSFSRGRPGE